MLQTIAVNLAVEQVLGADKVAVASINVVVSLILTEDSCAVSFLAEDLSKALAFFLDFELVDAQFTFWFEMLLLLFAPLADWLLANSSIRVSCLIGLQDLCRDKRGSERFLNGLELLLLRTVTHFNLVVATPFVMFAAAVVLSVEVVQETEVTPAGNISVIAVST